MGKKAFVFVMIACIRFFCAANIPKWLSTFASPIALRSYVHKKEGGGAIFASSGCLLSIR